MVSIEKRTNESGKNSYRVKVRLKGYPAQTDIFLGYFSLGFTLKL